MRQYPMPLRIVWVLLEHALIGFTMAQVSFAVAHVEVFGTTCARWWLPCLLSLSVIATFNANREIGRVYGWCLPRTLLRCCLPACDVHRALLAVDHNTAPRRAGGGQMFKARCERQDGHSCVGVTVLGRGYRHQLFETVVYLVVAVELCVRAVAIGTDALDFSGIFARVDQKHAGANFVPVRSEFNNVTPRPTWKPDAHLAASCLSQRMAKDVVHRPNELLVERIGPKDGDEKMHEPVTMLLGVHKAHTAALPRLGRSPASIDEGCAVVLHGLVDDDVRDLTFFVNVTDWARQRFLGDLEQAGGEELEITNARMIGQR